MNKNLQCLNLWNMPILSIFLIVMISGCKTAESDWVKNRDRYFNADWLFIRDSLPRGNGISGPETPGFDDSKWMSVDLPHDWSISGLPGAETGDRIGPFSKLSPGNTATGYVLGGTAWYRKHFKINRSDAGKTITIRFDGVYMETEVWINGHKAGEHVYGYTPFYFDITSLLNEAEKDNVIAVRVSNTGRNSRWYSGSGIYRNVFLTVTDPVHISVWGVHVVTSDVSRKDAKTRVSATLQNNSHKEINAVVKINILAPGNKVVSNSEGRIPVSAKSDAIYSTEFVITDPVLWSPSSPGLYQAEVSIETEGKLLDRYIQTFGIRSVDVSPETGFKLNGEPLELKGGCLHHDNGLLGSAAFERAEERRVQIMKANGFNAIRTSHNPPSEAFLNACDRLGMMVIDETFDMWERPKNPQDYHRFFTLWWMKDVESMILRDRNHPCIIMWSIGNEINERADTSGVRIGKSIISYISRYDDSRPFTNAICEFWDIPGKKWDETAPAFEILTVGGYNYKYGQYESDHGKFPQRIMMGTESVPMAAYENWEQVQKHPYVIGDFVWTGMDYLGETGIGHTQYLSPGMEDAFALPWPWFNAWCGDIDITGEKKPQMLYKDVIWGNSKLEVNVHAPVPEGKTEKVSYWGWPDEYPHWNWNGNEDKILKVSVYTRGSTVKLLLNGREIGFREITAADKYMAVFDVPYEPGELKVVAFEKDKVLAEKVMKTTGAPAAIRLTPDRSVITADRNDLAFVTLEIIDEFGQVVTNAVNQVKITVTGDGELAGSGNACPWDMKSIGKKTISAFHGKALVILRPMAKQGSISLKVTGDGLKEGTTEVKVE